jgi:transcriptional antiterminator NusG
MDVQSQPEKKMQWFAVNTLSNQELAARERLVQSIEGSHVKELFGEVIVPTEEVVEVTANGTRRKTRRRLMPGYMFVQFVMTEETWYLIKNSPKVIGFVGDDKNPRPMRDSDIAKLRQGEDTAGVARPKPKQTFEEGANVRVIEGPFLNFTGVVEEVMPQKQKVRVLVSIFGRATPVELDFVQVERA